MNEIEIFLRFSFLGLSAIISSISLVSLIKTKDMKIGYASLGFFLFTLEGILISGGVFSSTLEHLNTTGVLVGITFVALIFFYLSILKR